ncbi:MAG: diaminopimelate epimerase [Bdellovibrionales bacterium]|nr:diaminopimelate epimerase [Bdellovibrionales bacterium]
MINQTLCIGQSVSLDLCLSTMTKITFSKFNATGNDFVVIDNRDQAYSAADKLQWAALCALKSGIGADGVLLLEKSDNVDFKMRYINADGGEVEMCGNGARAITAFAHEVLSQKKETYKFETMNGVYECSLDPIYGYRLKMTELYDIGKISLTDLDQKVHAKNSLYMNTGVPHAVFEIEKILDYPVRDLGSVVRHDKRFPKGSNANFFEILSPKHIRIRTFERGVENETLSCGTGATATALAASKFYGWKEEVVLETLGGRLAVKFSDDLKEIYLCGKVEKIFTGTVSKLSP